MTAMIIDLAKNKTVLFFVGWRPAVIIWSIGRGATTLLIFNRAFLGEMLRDLIRTI